MKPPTGGTTAREATRTTRPYRARTMCGATAFVAVKALVRLRSSIRRQAAASVSRSDPPAKPPTAPTRTSTRARPGERRGAGQHVVLHVRVVDAALLDPHHDLTQRRVRLANERGAVAALLEALRQRELQELVHPSEDRRERPAREPLVLLVEEAERDEVGRLELGLPALLGARGLVLRECPVHPDDLERLLLQVVRLLDVE